MLRMGVVGYGYWGPNIVRNFYSLQGTTVSIICDRDESSRRRAQQAFPHIRVTSDYNEILQARDIEAVAIVTPVSTHFPLAKKALERGKHVFVEKPFTATAAEGEELLELAARKGLHIMVDHTFLFTGAVRKMKEMIDGDVLGKLYYYDSTRVNLGLFQHDVNVIWDLAPHDFAIMDHLISLKPQAVVATGQSHFNGLENIAYITVYFDECLIAHFNVNWLSPVKVRTTLVGGEKKMLVWNDVTADEKIKIYDRGVDVETREGVYNLLVNYRSGDMHAPRIEPKEALQLEVEHFRDCLLNGTKPINDGHAGLRVVRMLEAADKSLKNRGQIVYL